MNTKLEQTAKEYEKIALELEVAVQHFKSASQHFKNKEVPRGAAHAYAGWGHLNKVEVLLKAESINHAENSRP